MQTEFRCLKYVVVVTCGSLLHEVLHKIAFLKMSGTMLGKVEFRMKYYSYTIILLIIFELMECSDAVIFISGG
jgi:hypothetical protein